MNDIARIRQAVRTAAFDEALAEHLDLNPTDLRCLELAIAEPGVTPGRLAERSGLTTGAITGVLDRLEKAGFVERRPDPADRRSVGIHPVPARVARLVDAVAPLDAGIEALLGGSTPGEREAIGAFLAATDRLLGEATARLRASTRGGFLGETFRAPLGDTTRGRLVFVSGAPRFSLNLAPLGPQAAARLIMETTASRLEFAGPTAPGDLVEATFDGPLPDVRRSAGVVTVRYRRQAMSAFTGRRARIALNGSVPWSIELEGGLTDLTGTLEGVQLERMEIGGGANHVRLDLPQPAGSVAIRLAGVASSAQFRRPAAVPVALRVAGGVSHLRFDGRALEQVAGKRRIVGSGFAEHPDRYEIEVLRGASEVVIAGT